MFFTKMHSIGNDFILIDLVTQHYINLNHQICHLADRHIGIGFDQLLLVEPSRNPKISFRYRIYNADGSEAENCGNGARCFTNFVRNKRLTCKREIMVETYCGQLTMSMSMSRILVNMGTQKQLHFQFKFQKTKRKIELSIVNFCNPHAVILVAPLPKVTGTALGHAISSHPCFPHHTNVGFMQLLSPSEAILRFFERGVGDTQACGTGACAAVAICIRRGILQKATKIVLHNGMLIIEWSGQTDDPLFLTGKAKRVFEGKKIK